MKEGAGSDPPVGNFDGLRVIDFTLVLSGPYCCKLMADMGAEVIKIEPPVTGDTARGGPYNKNGASGFYMYRNGGKRSLCLDMKNPEAVEIVRDLVKISDVLVQNRRVGVAERLGIGYDDLHKINPRLIMCSISGYGQYGPLSDWPANDANIQAMCGAMGISGHPDGPPLPSWVPWVDVSTGTHAMGAIGAALYYRDKTGRGQHIDVSMFDCAFTQHDYAVEEYLMSDGRINRTRKGPYHPSSTVMGVYKCRDSYVYMIGGRDWPALATLIGHPEIIGDPRFSTPARRLENREEVIQMIVDWVKDYDLEDARILLQENGVIALPILSIEESLNQPHVEVRELFTEVDHPQAGRMKMPNIPIKFSGTASKVRGPAPLLGQHNDEVLAGVLGYGQERIKKLWENKVLWAEEAVSIGNR